MFTRIHDRDRLRAEKRLFMTATPRIYTDAAKTRARQANKGYYSMDEAHYGEEFYRLNFGEAVEQQLLSDYKVLILCASEQHVSRRMQGMLADNTGEIPVDDAAKILGCWDALTNPGREAVGPLRGQDSAPGKPPPSQVKPLKRAVAFCGRIVDSKQIASQFETIVDKFQENAQQAGLLQCETDHVDGSMNALQRNQKIHWLENIKGADKCRILHNVRCLSEGVDVPALDAVLFMSAKKSKTDIVQSVGRVMRKAKNKEYGYIILPIVVPAGESPEKVLDRQESYEVIWDVLRALRSHDSRMDAEINKLDLNNNKSERIQVIGLDEGRYGEGDASADDSQAHELPPVWLQIPNMEEWGDAIYARIVEKCGDRKYWEDWAGDVAQIAERSITHIRKLVEDGDPAHRIAFEEFVDKLQQDLNPAVTADAAIEMLAQHLITRPVFEALFEDYRFVEQNPVSQGIQKVLADLDAEGLQAETHELDEFYKSVRLGASKIDNVEGRQRVVIELYEKFFRNAFPKMAESLGIVYTPVEIVDFMLHSTDYLLRKELGVSLGSPHVNILAWPDTLDMSEEAMQGLLEALHEASLQKLAPDAVVEKFLQDMEENPGPDTPDTPDTLEPGQPPRGSLSGRV